MCADCAVQAYSMAEREGGRVDDYIDDGWRANHSLRAIRFGSTHAARYADGTEHYGGVVDVAVTGGVL